jgi:hypothetical protein
MGCALHPLGGCLCWQNPAGDFTSDFGLGSSRQAQYVPSNTATAQAYGIGAADYSWAQRLQVLELEVKSLRALTQDLGAEAHRTRGYDLTSVITRVRKLEELVNEIKNRVL